MRSAGASGSGAAVAVWLGVALAGVAASPLARGERGAQKARAFAAMRPRAAAKAAPTRSLVLMLRAVFVDPASIAAQKARAEALSTPRDVQKNVKSSAPDACAWAA